ncbi:unnamed protein product [Rotaria socialis]|uniref:Uncharacterized protein n=3 Tax=Rotaria socialis TaxID=392032 RepID=A0A820Y505_9BILA|nr:unnamed protein product [Rotaria socialis]
MKLFEVDSRFIFETSSLIHPSKHTYGMAIIYSIEKINERLNQLRIEEENNETERSQLLDHLKKFSSNEDTLKVVAALTSLHKNMELIKEERLEILKHFPRHMEEDTISARSKKIRRNLPPTTIASKWNLNILNPYLIQFEEVYTFEELLFQTPPKISDRALRFIDVCSLISLQNLLRTEFPPDHQASCFAKHLYLTMNQRFSNMESSIDDAATVLFDALGFNDAQVEHSGYRIPSRNKLQFQMSNKVVYADADLTVFNLRTAIRLAVVENKRVVGSSNECVNGEPQLVAEAVAAAMYNEKIIAKNRRRTVSAPAATGVNLSEIPSADTSVVSNQDRIFMMLISGLEIRFYAHKFSNMILNCIANEIEPNETTQIEKFSVMENGVKRHGLSLVDADDRAIIFRIMDSIQQTISTVLC